MKKKSTVKGSRTDWKKLESARDAKVDTSDIPELGVDFFRHAKLRMPEPKQLISLRIDRDVLDWLKRQGKGYQTKINAILRAYVRAHSE
jgi:uncharacterized protein (DUF4415 family)